MHVGVRRCAHPDPGSIPGISTTLSDVQDPKSDVGSKDLSQSGIRRRVRSRSAAVIDYSVAVVVEIVSAGFRLRLYALLADECATRAADRAG